MNDATDRDAGTDGKGSGESRPWGSIRQSGKARYFVRFTAEGHQYERGPFSTWNAADKMRRRARALLEAGTPIADVLSGVFGDFAGARLTFRDAAPHYLAFAANRKRASSLADDRYRLGQLCRAPWAGKILGTLRPADFLPWINERQTSRRVKRLRPRRPGESREAFNALPDDERFVAVTMPGASALTVNKDLALVSALFKWAIGAGYVEANPVRRVARLPEKGRPERCYLTASEAAALIASAPDVVRPFVLAAVHTGARRAELLALRWRSVDLVRRELTIEAGTEKAGRGRTIPLTATLHGTLAAMRDGRQIRAIDGSDPVFVVADGAPLTPAIVRDAFASAVARCDALPPEKRAALTLHGLRHSAASIMVAAGVPILDVARILGHSTLAVTMRYARFAPESGRSAVEALGAALSGAAPAARSAATGS